MTRGHESGICVTVVVGKSSRPHKEASGFAARADYNAKVLFANRDQVLLLGGDVDLNARQVFDGLILADRSSSGDAGLVGDDCVSIGRIDLPGTVREVDVDVATQMAAKVLFFLVGFEGGGEPAQAIGGQEPRLGGSGVLVYNNLVLQNLGNGVFLDSARGWYDGRFLGMVVQ